MTVFETKYDAYYGDCLSVFARTGSVEELFRAADAIADPDTDYRDVTLGKLARFLVERQQIADASRFCSAIGDPLERANAMLRLAGVLLEMGQPEVAKRFLNDVARAAESFPGADDTATTLLQVAALLEQAGALAEAERALQRAIELSKPASRQLESAKTLRGCARLLATWNRLPDAIDVAGAIELPELRAVALEEIQGRGKWPIAPGVRTSSR